MKLPSFQQIINTSSLTFERFPFVLLSSIIGTIVGLILIGYNGPPAPTILFKILFAAIPGIPLFLALALMGEKRRWSKSQSMIATLAGITLLIVYGWSVPSNLPMAPNMYSLRLFMVCVALHFCVAVAPYTRSGEENGFWQFNKTLLLRAIMAFVFSGVLFIGLALALVAIDNLFQVRVPEMWYAEVWILICGIFTTWFFLAGIPENLDQLESSTDYPKGLKIFAQYVLLSLVVVYLVILYAYIAKILITWELPEGWVSKLILCFSATGIFSLLLLYPLRSIQENVWIRAISRWFYVALLPLFIMLMVAIGRRTSDYGLTVSRYITVVLGIWLGCIAVYFILSKNKNIKIIPASLGLLTILIAFGPWSAFSVSEKSQIQCLKDVLTRDSILVGGKISNNHGKISSNDSKQIRSIIAYLHEVHGYDGIQPWFDASLSEYSTERGSTFKDPDLVMNLLGVVSLRHNYQMQEYSHSFFAKNIGVREIEGYDRMVDAGSFDETMRKKIFPEGGISCCLNEHMDTATVKVLGSGDSLQVGLRSLVEQLLTAYSASSRYDIDMEKMSVVASNQHLKVKIYFDQIQVDKVGNENLLSTCILKVLYSIM